MNRSGNRNTDRARKLIAAVAGTALVGMTTAGLFGETVHASTVGDGLYSALSGIYGTSSTGSSSTSSASSQSGSLFSQSSSVNYSSGTTTSSGGGSQGGTAEVNGRRVITYYPIYNRDAQQRANIQQQLNQQMKQNYWGNNNNNNYYVNANGTVTDVSGNTYNLPSGAKPDVSGNTLSQEAMNSTIDQMKAALVPDIPALESDPVGPIVNTVSLSESYHENYQIYEERFSDLYAIYTNIANGSISNRPAIFDVPNGVSVRMTRDGKDVGFSNKAQIKEEGTYVGQFYVTQDGSEELPGWQQTIERARFVFRIQYTAGLDGQPLVLEQEPSELSSFADLVQGDSEVLLPGTTEEPEEEPAEEPAAEEPAQPEEETKPAPGIVSATNGLSTAYDSSTGYYRISLLTGDSFSSNIPDGMVTNGTVTFLEGEGMRFEVTRGGEPVEYTSGDYLSESGDYIVIPVIDNLDYESYYRINKPLFRFRIVNDTVSDMGAFTAPETMTISAVRHGSEDVSQKVMLSDTSAALSEDGRWEVDLTGEGGSTTVVVNRDTVPPKVTVKTEPNAAHISYESEDIVRATLTRGAEVVSDGDLLTVVTQAGRYHLTVTDIAGNVTEKDFAVQYRINIFAILAIVIVFTLIAALIIFLRRVKTNVRVR